MAAASGSVGTMSLVESWQRRGTGTAAVGKKNYTAKDSLWTTGKLAAIIFQTADGNTAVCRIRFLPGDHASMLRHTAISLGCEIEDSSMLTTAIRGAKETHSQLRMST